MSKDINLNMLSETKKIKILELYNEYVVNILTIKNIEPYSFKRTITDSIFSGEDTTPKKVRAALSGTDYSIGDKHYFYFRQDGSLSTTANWQSDHCVDTLLEKLYKTIEVFEPVLGVIKDTYPNYSLKRNKKLLIHLTTNK